MPEIPCFSFCQYGALTMFLKDADGIVMPERRYEARHFKMMAR